MTMHSCRDLLKFCVTHQCLQTVQIQERSSHVMWPLSQLTKVNKVQLFQARQGGYFWRKKEASSGVAVGFASALRWRDLSLYRESRGQLF